MATVRIDQGIQATFLLECVPRARWKELVNARRTFAAVHITNDCRCLLEWLQDAEKMWKPLGYKSADDLISNGYKLHPEEIRLAADWLKVNDPNYAIGLPAVVNKAQQAARENKEPLAANGEVGNGRPKVGLMETENIKPTLGGTSAAYRIRRLRRDCPEAAERLERGEFRTVAAAERWAKGEEPHPAYPKKTALTWLEHWWSKADEKTRREFRERIDQEKESQG